MPIETPLDRLQDDLENQLDLRLLKSAPGQLLVKYQWLLQYLVSGYVKRGFVPAGELQEVVQELNTRLLGGPLKRMADAYDGRSKVRTYLGVVVRSQLSDYLKQQRTQKATLVETTEELPEATLADENAGPAQLAVADELRRLELAFKLVPRVAAKLVLFLQLWLRFPLADRVLVAYAPGAPVTLRKRVLDALAAYATWEEQAIYPEVVPLVAQAEGAAPHPDSLRRWNKRKRSWLIAVLNGDPPRARYTDDSLAMLLQLYFRREAPGD